MVTPIRLNTIPSPPAPVSNEVREPVSMLTEDDVRRIVREELKALSVGKTTVFEEIPTSFPKLDLD